MFPAYKKRDEGLAALQLNKYDEAAKLFEEASSFLNNSHPEKCDFLCLIAKAHFLRGDYHTAIEFSGMALKIKKNYPPALYRIGLSLCGMRRYSEGINCLREAAMLDPSLKDKVNAKIKDAKNLAVFYENQQSAHLHRIQQRQHPVQIRRPENLERSFIPSSSNVSTRQSLLLPSTLLDSPFLSSTASTTVAMDPRAPSNSFLPLQKRQMITTCIVCEEQFDSFHLNVSSNCHLQPACCICLMRLRSYYEDFRCLHCFQLAEIMVCSKNPASLRENDQNFTLDPMSKLYFPFDYYNRTVSLLHSTTCQVCLVETADHGALLRHLADEHGVTQCKLCAEFRSIFPFERKIYNKEEYCMHLDYGDGCVNQGHPTCQECRMRFFDHDYLLLHIKLKHPLEYLKISTIGATRSNSDGGTRHLATIVNSFAVMSVSWVQTKKDVISTTSSTTSSSLLSSSDPILPPGFDGLPASLAPPGPGSVSSVFRNNQSDLLLPTSSTPPTSSSSSSSILTSSLFSYSNGSNNTSHHLLGGLLSSSTNYLSSHSNAFGYDLTDDNSNSQSLFFSSNILDPSNSLPTNLALSDLNKDSETYQGKNTATTSSSTSSTPTMPPNYFGNTIMNNFFSSGNSSSFAATAAGTTTTTSGAASSTNLTAHLRHLTNSTTSASVSSRSSTPIPPPSLPEEEPFLESEDRRGVLDEHEAQPSPASRSSSPSRRDEALGGGGGLQDDTPSSPRIEDDELPEDVFPCVDWLREKDMCMFKWSGTEEEWTEYALNLPSPVFSYLKKDDSHIIRDIAEQTECAIRIDYEFLRGAKVPFLVFTRGPSGAPSNIAMETALEITSNILRNYFSESRDGVWGRRPRPRAAHAEGSGITTSSSTSSSISSSSNVNGQILYEARMNLEARVAADSEERRKKAAESKSISRYVSVVSKSSSNTNTSSSNATSSSNNNNNNSGAHAKPTRHTQQQQQQQNETSEKKTDEWIFNKRTKPKKSETINCPENPEGYVERAVEIPREVVGKVIGQNGKKIKEICAASGARVQFRVNKAAEKDGRPGLLEATGQADCVEKGLFLVRELLLQMEKDYKEIPHPNISGNIANK